MHVLQFKITFDLKFKYKPCRVSSTAKSFTKRKFIHLIFLYFYLNVLPWYLYYNYACTVGLELISFDTKLVQSIDRLIKILVLKKKYYIEVELLLFCNFCL